MCSVTNTSRKVNTKVQALLGSVLSPNEVAASSVLIDRLEENGLSRVNARQVLRRAAASQDLWRSEHLELEGGGRLFCWRKFWGSLEFHAQVSDILRDHRRGLHRVVLAIRKSPLLRPEVEKILATPMSPRAAQRYPSLEAEAAALAEIGAVRWEGTGTALERLTAFGMAGSKDSIQMAKARWARRTMAAQLTKILVGQLRAINFISWGSLPQSGGGIGMVSLNNLPFDHVGFSWMKPLLRFTKKSANPSSTPVVLDVHAEYCEAYLVEAFLDRIKRAGGNKTSRLPIVGIIAAPAFAKEAWRLAKNEGLMTINLQAMFGDSALNALAAGERLLSQIGIEPGEKAEAKDAEIEQLRGILDGCSASPIIQDLRSIGMEITTALILSARGWSSIILNGQHPFRPTRGAETTRELDVFGRRGDEIYAVECKAEYSDKSLDPGYVQKFFCETVPSMVRMVTERKGGRMPDRVFAEIWTTGKVGNDAHDALSALSLGKHIEARLRDAGSIKSLVPADLPACNRLIDSIAVPPAAL